MNRREFCKIASLAGGSLILAPLVNACSAPSALTPEGVSVTSTPTIERKSEPGQVKDPTVSATAGVIEPGTTATVTSPAESTATAPISPNLARSQVALVKTEDRAAGVAQAVQMLGLGSFQGQGVLLKPNFNSDDPSPGSTHPDILKALMDQLVGLDAGPITLADRSGMGDTRRVMERIGVFDLVRDFDCRTVVFDELAEEEWIIYRQPGLHWQNGFPVPRMLLEAANIVQTCNLKTHRYGGHFTLSLKNSVGFVAKTITDGGYNYMTELHNSPYQRLMIAEINAVYEPDLIVMDGVEAFVQGGPAQGKKVSPGVVLAGSDRVALDAVGVAILRLFGTTPEVRRGRIFEQEQIARAAELGLGVARPEEIEFITAEPEGAAFADELRQLLTA